MGWPLKGPFSGKHVKYRPYRYCKRRWNESQNLFSRNICQKFIINTGEPFWNLKSSKNKVSWATKNGKQSKTGLHVASGAPNQPPKQCFRTDFFKFERYKFWKVCFSTASYKHCCDASFPDFSSSHQTLFHFNLLKDLLGTTTGVPFLEPPWATWSPVLDCFPCFVAHETLFFELFRFQKGSPVFIMNFWQIFQKKVMGSFIHRRAQNQYVSNSCCFPENGPLNFWTKRHPTWQIELSILIMIHD